MPFHRRDLIKRLILLLIISTSIIWAQEGEKQDVWKQFKYFVGSWEGHETGVAGIGKGEREYAFVLNDQFLHAKNQSVFEPQEKNPEGEVHEDWAFVSYDKIRGLFVLREFHVEGFINQYTLDTPSSDSMRFVFISESIENISEGWRARQILTIQSEDEFSETFELAAPGKDFHRLLENYWRRKK